MKRLLALILVLFLAVPAFAADWELTDPAADKLIGWDDSTSAVVFFGLGTGLTTSATPTLDLHASLTSIAGLTETNGGIPYGTADNAYAWLAAGGAGKLLMGAGASAPVWTTPTFPNAATTTGAYLRADGTNFIQSTLVLPNAGTAFKLPVFSAANTMTELAAVGATNQVLLGATGAIPAWSAYTLAAPGAAGGILYSDGTNWTRATSISGSFDIGTSAASGHAVTMDADGVLQTAFTNLLPDAADGAALGSATAEWSDLFLADGAVINLGADQDVTLTHVADAGITLNSTMKFHFGDTGTYVNQSADGTLNIVADTIAQVMAPNIKLGIDAAAYLNVATADGGATTISQVSDGADGIVIGDGVDDEVKLRMPQTTANGTWSGITIEFADCAASLPFGAPVYVQSTGKPALANATAIATMPAIGIIVVASTSADDPCTVLTHGRASATAWPTLTSGGPVYVDDASAGTVTQTVGDVAGTDHVVQVLGIGLSGDTMLVNPSFSVITLE